MQIQTFNFEDRAIRTKLIDNNPFFCAVDVCKILDIVNGRDAIKKLDAGDVVLTDTPTNGGVQKASFINETGLYALIFQSRKPEAKKFQKWVFSEVLPQIRQSGKYEVQASLPQNYLDALKALVKSEEEKIQLQDKNIKYSQVIEEFTHEKDVYSIRESAKRLRIFEKELRKKLFEFEWLMYSGGEYYWKATVVRSKYGEHKAILLTNGKYKTQPMITNKGLEYLVNNL